MWLKKVIDYYLKNQSEVREVLLSFVIGFLFAQLGGPLTDLFSADFRLFLTDLKISEGLTRSRLSLIGIIISLYSLIVILSLMIRGFPKILGRILMTVETLIIIVIVNGLCFYYDRYQFSDRLILCLCYTYLLTTLINIFRTIRKKRRHHLLNEE